MSKKSEKTDYKRLWRKSDKERVKAQNNFFFLTTILDAMLNFVKDKLNKEDYEKLGAILGRKAL